MAQEPALSLPKGGRSDMAKGAFGDDRGVHA